MQGGHGALRQGSSHITVVQRRNPIHGIEKERDEKGLAQEVTGRRPCAGACGQRPRARRRSRAAARRCRGADAGTRRCRPCPAPRGTARAHPRSAAAPRGRPAPRPHSHAPEPRTQEHSAHHHTASRQCHSPPFLHVCMCFPEPLQQWQEEEEERSGQTSGVLLHSSGAYSSHAGVSASVASTRADAQPRACTRSSCTNAGVRSGGCPVSLPHALIRTQARESK